MPLYTFKLGGERLDAAAFAARHRAWVRDPAALRALSRQPARALRPASPPRAPGPLFAPWRDAILATAVPSQALVLGDEAVTASPERSFGHGLAAFLPSPEWPRCGGCGTPLELCCQLAPGAVEPWTGRPGSLVLMYCFRCHPSSSDAGGEAVFLRIVEPRTLAVRPAGPSKSSSHTSTTRTRGVEVRPPSWQVPGGMELCYRLDKEDLGGAASLLLGREAITVWAREDEKSDEEDDEDEDDEEDEEDDDLDEEDDDLDEDEDDDLDEDDGLEEIDASQEYADWAYKVKGGGGRAGGALGGYPRWDQADETPACAGCGAPMQLLVDWNGEQFLDGALHVFLCDRTPACSAELAFVAEF